jgi:hypothetical protein
MTFLQADYLTKKHSTGTACSQVAHRRHRNLDCDGLACVAAAAQVMVRRFPPPWSVEDIGPAFIVMGRTNYFLKKMRSAASPKAAVSFVYPCRCYAGFVHHAD